MCGHPACVGETVSLQTEVTMQGQSKMGVPLDCINTSLFLVFLWFTRCFDGRSLHAHQFLPGLGPTPLYRFSKNWVSGEWNLCVSLLIPFVATPLIRCALACSAIVNDVTMFEIFEKRCQQKKCWLRHYLVSDTTEC